MNKKLIKTIASLTCGLGCVGAVCGVASSLSTSKKPNKPFIIKSTSKKVLSKDPNFDIDYSPILGSYKALPEELFKFGGYKNQNLIGFVDGFDLASYIVKGYDTLIIPSLPSGGIVENTFSDGLKGIKNIAIRWCNKIDAGCFNNCESLENLIVTTGTMLVENSFNDCFQLRKIFFYEISSVPSFDYIGTHDNSFFANAGRDTYEDFESRTVWSYGQDHTKNEAAINTLFDYTQLPKNWSAAK